jgi:hypothetical protein
MGEHPHLRCARGLSQTRDRARHICGARHHALDQLVEGFVADPAALHQECPFLRSIHARGDRAHVVVERQKIDAPLAEPLPDLVFGVEVVGLLAQVEARVRRELRPQALDADEQAPGVVGAAQTGLPGPGGGMKDRGDAVGDRLPVAVDQRHIGREVDAGTGHHLPLERVAMQVDNARQHQEVAAVDAERAASVV